MPDATAVPVAVRLITSALASCPDKFAETVAMPPQRPETLPVSDVGDNSEICHWRFVQLPIFGSPAIVAEAQIPVRFEPAAELAEDVVVVAGGVVVPVVDVVDGTELGLVGTSADDVLL